jgi:arylsulfatase A-like enzyme
MKKRPTIIIFNPDEMRADSLHHLGNEASHTPNLDDIIKNDAVSFSNAFCQNPVCVPSRCSFMTGLYPHTNGHRTMSYLLRPGESSLLKELKDSGYYVWMNDRNDLTAGQYDGWTESLADEIYYNDPTKRAPGPKVDKKLEMGDKNFYSHFKGELGVDENGLNYSADDQAIDAAIERIKNPLDDRPLCIFLGLFYPHVPYQVENPYFSAIDRTKLKMRIKLSDTLNKAPILYAINKEEKMSDYTEDDYNELRATYLGMCMKVDYQFGKIVKALKETNTYDDSAIFFFSDHGDFTGDYSLVEKCQNSFEDCLTNVPFVVKLPKEYKVDPGVNDSLVELVDFYKTCLDISGTKETHTNFGRNLVANIANKDFCGRDYVFSEGGREPGETWADEYHSDGPNGTSPNNEYYPKKIAQKDDKLHDKGIMCRNKEYKYVSRSHTKDEFYDLINDPFELVNQIDNPKYKEIIFDMRFETLKWLERTSDIVPFDLDSRLTKKMLWSKVSQYVPDGYEDDIKNKIDSGMGLVPIIMYCLSINKTK